MLLNHGCDVSGSLENGLTALHLTVEMKDPERTQLLLEHDAKCNAILYTEVSLTHPTSVIRRI